MKAEVVYIDQDPWGGEYIIVKDGEKYYYGYIDYYKFEFAEIEEIENNVDEFAWSHGLMKIESMPLDKYIEYLKSLFKS